MPSAEGEHPVRKQAQTSQWEVLIRSMLPLPIRIEDGILIGGEPGEVVVRISEGRLEVAAYAVIWDSQDPRLAPEGWKTFPMTAKPERVAKAIIKARTRRIATFEWCPRCASVRPPECMSDGICQTCAEKDGVVF
jgi:hypothetical protein